MISRYEVGSNLGMSDMHSRKERAFLSAWELAVALNPLEVYLFDRMARHRAPNLWVVYPDGSARTRACRL